MSLRAVVFIAFLAYAYGNQYQYIGCYDGFNHVNNLQAPFTAYTFQYNDHRIVDCINWCGAHRPATQYIGIYHWRASTSSEQDGGGCECSPTAPDPTKVLGDSHCPYPGDECSIENTGEQNKCGIVTSNYGAPVAVYSVNYVASTPSAPVMSSPATTQTPPTTTPAPTTPVPTTAQPATTQPITTQPATTQPATTVPATTQAPPTTTPAPSTPVPTTAQGTTKQPTTSKPTTVKPTTKPTTVKPTTVQPTPKPTTIKPSTTPRLTTPAPTGHCPAPTSFSCPAATPSKCCGQCYDPKVSRCCLSRNIKPIRNTC